MKAQSDFTLNQIDSNEELIQMEAAENSDK